MYLSFLFLVILPSDVEKCDKSLVRDSSIAGYNPDKKDVPIKIKNKMTLNQGSKIIELSSLPINELNQGSKLNSKKSEIRKEVDTTNNEPERD
jgi:hypothetical protein